MKTKKLEAYLGMAGSVLGAGALQGQVIYTDFNPDVVLDLANSPVTFSFDIDQDGSQDFEIDGYSYFSTASFSSVYTTTYGQVYSYFSYNKFGSRNWDIQGMTALKKVAMEPSAPFENINAFNAGNSIGPNWSGNFQVDGDIYDLFYAKYTGNYGSYLISLQDGEWQSIGLTHFAGIELEKNGQKYYGWVRMTRNSDQQLTLHDMAISDVPGLEIVAGDTTVGNPASLGEGSRALVRIGKGPNKLIVQTLPLISDFQMTISNTAGQQVWAGNGKPGEKVEIDLREWAHGTYIIHMRTARGKMLRRKIVH